MNAPRAIVTECLRLDRLDTADADFIRHLVNDPDWLRFIGDRQVATREDALRYLEQGPLRTYRELGLGLLRVALRDSAVPIGLCGLLRRENRDAIELGFALLPEFRRRGYAGEAARAVLDAARAEGTAARIEAIMTPDNAASRALLARLGFARLRTLPAADDGAPLDLYELPLI